MSNNLPKLDLNILPDSYRGRRLSAKQVIFLLAIVMAIVLVIFIGQATFDAREKTADLREEIDLLNQEVEEGNIELNERAEMVRTVQEYQAISGKRGILTEDLSAINSAAEEVGIQIASVSHESESVVISCPTSGYSDFDECRKAFDDYCEALKQPGRFSSAEYSLPSSPPPVLVAIEVKR